MYCLCVYVLYYCHRVTTQLQLTNVSYHIITYSSNLSRTARQRTHFSKTTEYRYAQITCHQQSEVERYLILCDIEILFIFWNEKYVILPIIQRIIK